MFTTLRGCIYSSEVRGSRPVATLPVIAQVSRGVPELLKSQTALLVLALLIVLLVGGVIFPAVWSRDRARRTAALKVLDRLLRWRR